MDLDLLKGFEAAARHLSFTRAAEDLFVTQSALSRQIKTLEDQMGVALFERRRNQLRLTTEGEVLRAAVDVALQELGDALARIQQHGKASQLKISTTVAFASLWLIPRLARFRVAHPDVDVLVSADNRVVDLGRADVDLVVRYCAEESAPEDAVRLFGEHVIPVASPSLLREHSAQGRDAGDLANYVLLHYDDALGRTPWLDWPAWLASHGIAIPHARAHLRFNQYDQVLQAAAEGQGVALGRMPLIHDLLDKGRLAVLPVAGHDVPRAYFAVPTRRAHRSPFTGTFIAWLVDQARAESIPG